MYILWVKALKKRSHAKTKRKQKKQKQIKTNVTDWNARSWASFGEAHFISVVQEWAIEGNERLLLGVAAKLIKDGKKRQQIRGTENYALGGERRTLRTSAQ